MPHVFVETNWLHDYAAPAHHKVPEAVTLLERAKRGEFTLHVPNVSVAEARQSIQTKCQPVDGPAIHRYIRWAHKSGELSDEQAKESHELAERYVQSIHKELSAVPSILKDVVSLACVEMFALDDDMLDLANQLAFTKVAQKPFDHAILAGILVSSFRLWSRGERAISFAEIDSDLQPWGSKGAPKDDLRKLYDDAHVWVYGDFTLQFPPRREDFEQCSELCTATVVLKRPNDHRRPSYRQAGFTPRRCEAAPPNQDQRPSTLALRGNDLPILL